MQAAQDRERDDLARGMRCWHRSSFRLGNLLSDPLMGSCLVEGGHVGIEDTVELPLMEDEQVIEALATYTAQEALTDGIGARGVIRGYEHINTTGLGNSREGHAKFAIVITDEIFRSHAIRGGFAKRYVRSKRQREIASRPRGSLCASAGGW